MQTHLLNHKHYSMNQPGSLCLVEALMQRTRSNFCSDTESNMMPERTYFREWAVPSTIHRRRRTMNTRRGRSRKTAKFPEAASIQKYALAIEDAQNPLNAPTRWTMVCTLRTVLLHSRSPVTQGKESVSLANHVPHSVYRFRSNPATSTSETAGGHLLFLLPLKIWLC